MAGLAQAYQHLLTIDNLLISGYPACRRVHCRLLFRKALYNIVLNQMSPRHISGILYEYPQFTM